MRGEQHFGSAECFWPTKEQRSAKPPALLTVAGSFQNTGPRPASRWTIEVVLRYCRLNWWSGKNRPPPAAHRNMDIHTGVKSHSMGTQCISRGQGQPKFHHQQHRGCHVMRHFSSSPSASQGSKAAAGPPSSSCCTVRDTAAELACRHWAGLPRQNVPQPARRLLSELLAAGANLLGPLFWATPGCAMHAKSSKQCDGRTLRRGRP